MQTPQYGRTVSHIAQAEHDMLAACGLIEETMHGEQSERRRKLRSSDKNDGHRVLLILDELDKGSIVTAALRACSADDQGAGRGGSNG